jgi:hypothetical protein
MITELFTLLVITISPDGRNPSLSLSIQHDLPSRPRSIQSSTTAVNQDHTGTMITSDVIYPSPGDLTSNSFDQSLLAMLGPNTNPEASGFITPQELAFMSAQLGSSVDAIMIPEDFGSDPSPLGINQSFETEQGWNASDLNYQQTSEVWQDGHQRYDVSGPSESLFSATEGSATPGGRGNIVVNLNTLLEQDDDNDEDDEDMDMLQYDPVDDPIFTGLVTEPEAGFLLAE